MAASVDAKEMAERSIRAGYMKDALKYLQMAHEADPADFNVMLKLGWTYNNLRDDGMAVRWFNLARRSPDPKIAAEAARGVRATCGRDWRGCGRPGGCSPSTPRAGGMSSPTGR